MDRRKSVELYENNKEYLFKATSYAEPVITHGQGSFVWDVDGNKYLDLNSGQFCVIFGHNYEPLNKVVTDQIQKIYHTNTMTITPEVLEAAKKMAEINNGDLKKTIFLSTGSEANECALRYAKFISGKNKIISMDKGYHGLTLASQSATMGGVWSRPRVEGSLYATAPDIFYKPDNISQEDYIEQCIDDLENILKQNENTVAAMLMEPILGVGGMIILPNEYLSAVRKLCDKYGIILIFDECQTGFGRTGDWFVYQTYNVIPDMVVSAKAMGLGFAVSAVTMKKKLADAIEDKITHFSSHQNDPFSSRIVSFTIEEIINKDLLKSNKIKGKELLDGLKSLSEKDSLIRNPRGMGLMCAFDLPREKVGNDRKITLTLMRLMQDEGVMLQAVRQGITFRIMPNYLITSKEIQSLLEKLDNCIQKIEKLVY